LPSISDLLSSPTWWATVVVAGLVINITSAYLLKIFDGTLSKLSVTWQARSSKRKHQRAMTIEALTTDDLFLQMVSFSEMRDRLRALQFGLMATAIAVLSLSQPGSELPKYLRIVSLAISAILFLLSSLAFNQSLDSQGLLFDAYAKRNEKKRNSSMP
jgi:hypothetical protein